MGWIYGSDVERGVVGRDLICYQGVKLGDWVRSCSMVYLDRRALHAVAWS